MTAPADTAVGAAVTEAEVEAAMRAFEGFSSVLRYREAEKWHINDVAGMRAALTAAAAARAPSPSEVEMRAKVERLRADPLLRDVAVRVIDPTSEEGQALKTTRQRALLAERRERNEEVKRLVTELIDAAIAVEPGRRDIDKRLQRAEKKLLRHVLVRR